MIDIRELRIGSHVLFKGERVKIESIDIHGAVRCSPKGYRDWHETDAEKLDPIPITEELLKELGFEKETSNAFRKYYCESEYFERIVSCCFMDGVNGGSWTVKYWDDGNRNCFFDEILYLHELEAFVYLTTKQELI